jgi:DNA-binding winged helix-turn-helix (wHTH) protein
MPNWRNEVTPKKRQNIEERPPFGSPEGVETPGSILPIYQFGDFTLDVARGCLLKLGQEIKLRPKVYEALRYLVENPGRLIAKQELMQAVWPDSFVTDDSLVQCTLELRRSLGDHDQQLLKTIPRRGYLFEVRVKKSAAKADTSRTDAALKESGTPVIQKIARKLVDLPTPRTPLIGRDQEVAQAAKLLLQPDVRLLSLT